jgi:hypothetical protein
MAEPLASPSQPIRSRRASTHLITERTQQISALELKYSPLSFIQLGLPTLNSSSDHRFFRLLVPPMGIEMLLAGIASLIHHRYLKRLASSTESRKTRFICVTTPFEAAAGFL